MDRQELLNINKNRKMEVESYHSEFDFDKYEITDERVIREVTQTEEDIRQIGKFMAKKALEMGRKLKRVQEILSNHGTGTFVAWFTSLGLDKNMVYREINRWEQFEKYRNPAIAEASIRTLEYIKKNNDNIIRQGKEITEKEDDDEILNEKAKEPVNDSIKYSSFFTLSEDISKREVRRKVDCNIVIGKVKKIISSSNVNKDSKEETQIITKAELEILDVLKGDLKEKSVIIKKLGGRMKYKEYLKGSKTLREKIKNNPEMKITEEEEEKEYVEYVPQNDVLLEEGKTYLFYLTKDKEDGIYGVEFLQYGSREFEKISKKTMLKAVSGFNKTNKINGDVRVKNNDTGKYENIEDVI